MSRIKIVMQETLKGHLKSGAFWAMILLPVIFGVLSGVGGYFAANSGNSQMGIVTSDELKPYFEDDQFLPIKEDEIDQSIDDGKISSYAKIREEDGQLIADFNEADASMTEMLTFQNILTNIQNKLNEDRASLDSSQQEILAKTPIINKIADEKSDNKMIGQIIYFILMFLMYMVLMSFVNLVLADIATEKGTKMIEFIFSSVRPGDYFAGKMFGNFIAVFVQIITYVIFGMVGFFVAQSNGLLDGINLSYNLTGSTYGMIAEIVLLFLLGIFVFLVIAGMLGSFATKVEDAGKMGTPLVLGTVILFFLAINLQGKGDIMLTKVLSYVPFASTFFMPLRLLNGYASLMEGLISVAILIVSILLVYKFGERVYKRNILNYSTDNWVTRRFKK
ncbi:ABC transporter permease [uncultured Anaerococcus sp.]|uniref:ABC transporter permease n=1 Tax=uncultured Anaerococcus sp. TaxID=293428 RepID=UPI0025F1E81B|nr:ABC transporter permease [uncultured Anaerococcus sp.]